MPNITSSRHSIVEREKYSLKDLAVQAHLKNLSLTLIVPPTTGTAIIRSHESNSFHFAFAITSISVSTRLMMMLKHVCRRSPCWQWFHPESPL